MMGWLSRAGFSLIIFIRCKEGTGSDFNHQPTTQTAEEKAGTHHPQRPPGYSHLRSALNLPGPVQDHSFVGPHVALPPGLQHAQEVSLPVLLLWFLILVFRQDHPRLNEKHKVEQQRLNIILLFYVNLVFIYSLATENNILQVYLSNF